jgi:heat shock protein HslJ
MRNKVVLITILSALTLIGLTACNTAKTALEDKEWVLASYGKQGDLQAVLAGTEITAIFDSAEMQVTGSAGCNSYSADYEVSGNKLSISDIASTDMACTAPEGVMDQEQEYLTLLLDTATFQVEGSQLTISSSDGQVLFFGLVFGTE